MSGRGASEGSPPIDGHRRLGAWLLSGALGMLVGGLLAGGALAHTNVNCGGGSCSGDDHANVIEGTGGYDNIEAKGGDDTVYAKPGGDDLFGNGDQDLIWGDDGLDKVIGDSGWDWYTCGGVNCGLEGQQGGDTIRGNDGTDFLSGGPDDDYLNGGEDGNHDHCNGGTGSDGFSYCHIHAL